MRTYIYRFSDNFEFDRPATSETMEEIAAYCDETGVNLVYNGFHDQLSSIQLLRANSHSKGDGWKPGYHAGLGQNFGDYASYQRTLKEKGMIEVGNEAPTKEKEKPKSLFDASDIQEFRKQGADLTDREASHLLKEDT